MSTPDPNAPPEPAPTPDPAPPADPEEIDLEALVGDIVTDKVKELTQPAPPVSAPKTEPAVPSEPKATDAGVVENAVRKVLEEKDHAAEHERLTEMGDRPPRQKRRGIARAVFGE